MENSLVKIDHNLRKSDSIFKNGVPTITTVAFLRRRQWHEAVLSGAALERGRRRPTVVDLDSGDGTTGVMVAGGRCIEDLGSE
ncbi:hypothetical protein Scep_002439 [Stephania cephalantha]|uniref:Uncharacterized protein n=1 Tax=Stephania cephalantha TaxID=152367 RepID=A0AAP0LA05_9MAGN